MTNVYPEHKKLAKIQPLSQATGGFLEWLSGQGYSICEYLRFDRNGVRLEDDESGGYTEGYHPVYRPIQEWLEEYFEIDGKKLEQEKRQILAQIRTPVGEVPTCE